MTTDGFAGTVALKRGLDFVRLLADAGPLTVEQLAERTGLRREAAERIVNTLRAAGFIEPAGAGSRFLPGQLMQDLAASYTAGTPALHIARPLLAGLAARHAVTARLVVMDGNAALCLLASGGTGRDGDPGAGRSTPRERSAAALALDIAADIAAGRPAPRGKGGDARRAFEARGHVRLESGGRSTLAVPLHIGETPAALETLLPDGDKTEAAEALAHDLATSADLIARRCAAAGIRALTD